MMLALLPENTLHILDDYSASAAWLEPFRNSRAPSSSTPSTCSSVAPAGAQLRGNGRLAVYFPDEVEPDAKGFRLYRAVAQIASKADARIVPIVSAAHATCRSRTRRRQGRRALMFPRLSTTALSR